MPSIRLPRRFAARCVAALFAVHGSIAAAADFAGPPTAIPDANTVGVDIPFNVSGILGKVSSVRLSLTMTHTFQGDLRATLISPGGVARLVIFARVGGKRGGSPGMSSNFGGTYVFDDDATSDLWAAVAPLGTDGIVPSGSYRTSSAGSPGLSDHGGCGTSLRLAFGGLSGAQVNGTWVLNVADMIGTDVGAISASVLSIESSSALFASGFEDGVGTGAPAVIGSCRRALYDFTGTGLSSYTVVRNTGGGPAGEVTWFVRTNTGGVTGTETSFVLGDATSSFIDGDFDGDAIADATVWVPGPREFRIRRSSRPGDVPLVIPFGQTGDDPTHIGDYDGDRIADLTVYRAGAASGDPSFTVIRLSSTGQLRTLTTGQNGQFPVGGVDYDGDGRADIALQSNAGSGVGRFRVYSGITGAQVDEFTFGTPTDVIVTGSHAGSPRADITVIRGSAGEIIWTTRDIATGVSQPSVTFGASATDFVLTGDYDGDGLDDYATWRPSATAGQSRFAVRRSSAPDTPLEVFLGQNGDYPVARSRSH